MGKFTIIQTTCYTLAGQSESLSIAVGGQDFVDVGIADLTAMQTLIGETMANLNI